MYTVPSSLTSQLSRPLSSIRALITLPPGPITRPIIEGGIFISKILGALAASCSLGVGIASFMMERMWVRAVLAFSRVFSTAPMLRPLFLMSSCIDVIPSSLPAILKSIIPSASSNPRMSVSIREFSSAMVSGSTSNPMATPATGDFTGTPASISPKLHAQTVAMDDEPSDCVMRLSARTVYGNSFGSGIDGLSALSAKSP
mmetsp:Transcript_37625/g.69403  ORF Transcript_37625/g.69403 Transcript_37625/m.69403 type:complete len:201 (-) Transcript_37625:334-936(-)